LCVCVCVRACVQAIRALTQAEREEALLEKRSLVEDVKNRRA
jgi:hypothetical protein